MFHRNCFSELQKRSVYEKVFRADNRLAAVYPDAGHDFPAEIRNQTYRFLDRRLR